MSPIKSLTRTATTLALAAVLASPALADDSQLDGVDLINVSLSGSAPQVTVRNVAADHQLQNLNLAVQENVIPVGVRGSVACDAISFENWKLREGYYLSSAAFGIGETSLLMSHDLPGSQSIDHTAALDTHTFQMPRAMLNHPQIDIDPVAIVLAAADQAPNKVNYLRQDHVINVQFPLRIEAGCAGYTRNKVTKLTIKEAAQDLSYLTKNVTLKIKYEGDPQLFALNAQLSQGGGLPNQLQAGDQPFQIIQMTFQPNMPHHVGACPATTQIRVFYKGQGKGQIRIRINDGGTTIHNSPAIAFDAKNGQQHYDFEIETPKASKFDLNKTVNHNLRVYFRGKGEADATWQSQYTLMDSDIWRHRCTPQMNPSLGGGPVGGVKQGGSPSPAVVKPKRAPLDPTPARPKRAE